MGALENGYPEGMDYLKLAFNIISPKHIALCLNLAGKSCVNLSNTFTYAELGAGFGVSIAGWAAQYPQGEFHSIDYNSNQTQWTRRLADMSGLDNLFVHNCTINQALSIQLPHFDFIIIHGVYSWVSDDVRGECRAFINKFLKPGGCVYLSYNAMPGFKDIAPMRALIQEWVSADMQDNPLEALKGGLDLLRKLKDGKAGFFENSPLAVNRLEHWLSDAPQYLMAELLGKQHKAYHFNELLVELAEAGVAWACSADLIHYLASLNPPPALKQVLPLTHGNTMGETVKDMFYNTTFRTDLFVRQGHGDTVPFTESLSETHFCLAHVHEPMPDKASRHNFHALLEKDIFRLLQAGMKTASPSIRQLMGSLGKAYEEVLESLCILMALDWVHPATPHALPSISQRVKRFNLCLQNLAGSETIMPVLSARSGWIESRDQLESLCIMARLREEPLKEYLLQFLSKENTAAGSEAERAVLENDIKAYLSLGEKRIENFLKRHALH